MNLVAPVRSSRSPGTFFTAQGLGDRIHLITILWCLHQHSGNEVILHLNGRQATEAKRLSFQEVLSLFPSDAIKIKYHDMTPQDDVEFIRYLAENGIHAKSFFYGDYPGWNEQVQGIEISQFISNIPPIVSYQPRDESKFVTEQWDSTGTRRRLSEIQLERIRDRYLSRGYSIVTVGGLAENAVFRSSLKEVVQFMSKAHYHIGVDSGFMHLAQLVMPSSRIHLYADMRNYWSHHLFRVRDRGAVISSPEGEIGKFTKMYVNLRYNSSSLLRLLHLLRGH